MVSTTGEQWAYYELNQDLRPNEKALPVHLTPSIERISENCEPGMCTVLFIGGAGGSLRSGVTENPVQLTNSVKNAITSVTCGGAPVFLWPGGGITFMVDVSQLPKNAFGYVPTPAVVAPIEFTMRLDDYAQLGGHVDNIQPLSSLKAMEGMVTPAEVRRRKTAPTNSSKRHRLEAGLLPDGKRPHVHGANRSSCGSHRSGVINPRPAPSYRPEPAVVAEEIHYAVASIPAEPPMIGILAIKRLVKSFVPRRVPATPLHPLAGGDGRGGRTE